MTDAVRELCQVIKEFGIGVRADVETCLEKPVPGREDYALLSQTLGARAGELRRLWEMFGDMSERARGAGDASAASLLAGAEPVIREGESFLAYYTDFLSRV